MRVGACLAFMVALCFAAVAVQADSQKLLHSERSLYREVLVYESSGIRCICFTRNCRVGRQTCMDTRRPDRFALNYTRMMLGALYLQPQPRSILIIGLGGGTLPRALMKVLPEAKIDTVEIDPAVVRVAKQYFDFSPDSRVTVAEQDGRVFVKRAIREQRQYDLIMLDAFDHEYIPEHLLTREFLSEVKTLLTPGGVLAANTFSSSGLYDHESVTYAAVFGTFFNLKKENRVIFAVNGALPDTASINTNSAVHREDFAAFDVHPEFLLPLFSTRADWNVKARILTDQYSPANLLNLK
ncbi:fused MFS/spermidine synthase [Povalibacter sp.]|uniref:spermidine synthase n=1 Tax=Povalibacter sp. TaxID=1962978 RepID=UPI002F3F3E0F